MKADGEGIGKLVLTGVSDPKIDVNYKLSHKVVETDGVSCSVPRVHWIASTKGEPLPIGDCDLIVGNEILRLRHCSKDPEWIVLSVD